LRSHNNPCQEYQCFFSKNKSPFEGLFNNSRSLIAFYMEKYVLYGLYCRVDEIYLMEMEINSSCAVLLTAHMTLICDKGRLVNEREHFNLYIYSSLFKTLYERNNSNRMQICQRISEVYSDLYNRCYVPHVEQRQRKMRERCFGTTTPLLKFPSFFQRFSRHCDNFSSFVNNSLVSLTSAALLKFLIGMVLFFSSSMVSNIHSDSELPSLVLRTRLLLQNFSLAAIKLWNQIQQVRKAYFYLSKIYILSAQVSHFCCPHNNMHICYLTNERKFRSVLKVAWRSFYVELCLLGLVVFNTIFLTLLVYHTFNCLSTATVLFVFNIMFSNLLFFCSFVFFMRDLFNDRPYGNVNEDYLDKSPELVIAETLQTHLFASEEFRKYLIQETLYSLAQNGSLTGLIHLLVLVLLVINRSMSGKSIHLSRVSVISVFSCVWIFLILTHLLFSTLQVNAIQNLDELFSTLSKGKTYLQTVRSNYAEIASQCDRTAVFHAFGAYLLRGHTLFTLFFLFASIVIFTITVAYHCRVRRQHDFLQSGLRDQSPHRRREKLFHTLIFSIATFFLSVLGQTYIEIAVFWVNDREEVATLTKWYHFARIAAFVDPVLNPLIVVARTPALRRQVRISADRYFSK
uniref:G_PROTEIN_RECEP_F1_2 domain-containing protein n=1 Tax=Angiostrongylus cantonensis TaxID=6313 RepID=A0A158P7J1_ANGCA